MLGVDVVLGLVVMLSSDVMFIGTSITGLEVALFEILKIFSSGIDGFSRYFARISNELFDPDSPLLTTTMKA
jgi:hypothetical protein